MARLLLLLEHKENARLLYEWLSEKYEVIFPGEPQRLGDSFDLGILDGPALDRLAGMVAARKKGEEPLFLPFLLVTPRQNVGFVTRHLWRTIDEIILTPIEKVELLARVEILLRARRHSVEAENRYFALANSSPVGVAIFQDEQIVFANEIFRQLHHEVLGAGKAEKVSKLLLAAYPPGGKTAEMGYRVELETKTGTRWLQCSDREITYRGRPATLRVVMDITQDILYEHELKQLSQRILDAQEQERRHIALELHDQIGQMLTAIKIGLQAVARTAESLPQTTAQQLEASIQTTEKALQQVRSLSLNLRPSMLDDLGLLPTLRWYIDQQARQSSLPIRLQTNLSDSRLSSTIETVCFRVIQEAITNALRHAQATQIMVSLYQEKDWLIVTIADNGTGFDVKAASQQATEGHSMELVGMRERVVMAGGSFKIESSPQQGTTIHARFPLDIALPTYSMKETKS